jgi:hypothetical protein
MGAKLRVKLKYALYSLSATNMPRGPCGARRTGAVFVKDTILGGDVGPLPRQS